MNDIRTTDTLAAIDLGSNSFHMIIARVVGEELQIVDRIKDMVRLRGGLLPDGTLSDAARQRALDALARFGERLRGMPVGTVRAVGTNTLRLVDDGGAFLREAEAALGHPIDIISGREEGRLVYLGVSNGISGGSSGAERGRRLVMDIGGGSTEIILGDGLRVEQCESLEMGCVSFSDRFFSSGTYTNLQLRVAILTARRRIRSVRYLYSGDWSLSVGSSGTFKSVLKVHANLGLGEHHITRDGLQKIARKVVELGGPDRLTSIGVSADRAPVFIGGLAVVMALAESFGLETIEVSDLALREGVIYDLAGRKFDEDVRHATVARMAGLFHIDTAHADRVRDTALSLFDQAQQPWQLDHPEVRDHLAWAALLHEIGLMVSHDQHHKHGSYLVENSDMPGFSRGDHKLLWVLVRTHRKSFKPHRFKGLPEGLHEQGMKLCVLLRLAVLLNRSRTDDTPEVTLEVEGPRALALRFAPDWLDQAPLTREDLDRERLYLGEAGWSLAFS